MSRLTAAVGLFLISCCSSPQGASESSDQASAQTEPTASSDQPVRSDAPSTENDGSTAECDGEPWQAAYPAQEGESPPTAYLHCTEDGECAEREMADCCGAYAVAVNSRYAPCIAERSAGANCRAHCALPRPGEEAPARRPSCRAGSCRLVTADGSAQVLLRLPFDPNR